MKIEYRETANALYVQFREAPVTKSKEIEEGIILDFDQQGNIIGIEILDASKKMRPEDLVNFLAENQPEETGGIT